MSQLFMNIKERKYGMWYEIPYKQMSIASGVNRRATAERSIG